MKCQTCRAWAMNIGKPWCQWHMEPREHDAPICDDYKART